MRLNQNFLTHTIGNEQIMVATGSSSKKFHGMVQSNATAAFIVDCLKQDTTEEKIVDAILTRYVGVDRSTATTDVREILEKLRRIQALVEV